MRRAELLVVGLLSAAAVCSVGFIVVYALDRTPHQTQFLGLALGLAFLFFAAASAIVGLRVIGDDELDEEYPVAEHTSDVAEIDQVVADAGERFTRKRLVLAAGAGAAGALGAALAVPALSLGPALDLESFTGTPWFAGRRLVGEDGKPLHGDDIEEDTFYTAYPEHADREQLAAPLVVVRLPNAEIHLPAGRADWAPGGILAYSKVCTHAGCAISLYRKPTFPPVQPKPALVCPCHYSTFDPATGGTVLFGPAGRPLPQLPLALGRSDELHAAGTFSGPVGPSWWGVRSRKARP